MVPSHKLRNPNSSLKAESKSGNEHDLLVSVAHPVDKNECSRDTVKRPRILAESTKKENESMDDAPDIK